MVNISAACKTFWQVWIKYVQLKLHCLSPQKLFGSQESSSVQLWVSYNRQPMKAARFMTRHPITVSPNTSVNIKECCEFGPLELFFFEQHEAEAAAAAWMSCGRRFIILLLPTLRCMCMFYGFRAIMTDYGCSCLKQESSCGQEQWTQASHFPATSDFFLFSFFFFLFWLTVMYCNVCP